MWFGRGLYSFVVSTRTYCHDNGRKEGIVSKIVSLIIVNN